MGIYNNICHSRSSGSSKSIGIFCAYIVYIYNGWVDGECVVCAQGDGIFHVFPPDDPSPMSTHCNRWEKSFPVILPAGPDLEYLPCHQIRTRTLTDRIRIVWSPQKKSNGAQAKLENNFQFKSQLLAYFVDF